MVTVFTGGKNNYYNQNTYKYFYNIRYRIIQSLDKNLFKYHWPLALIFGYTKVQLHPLQLRTRRRTLIDGRVSTYCYSEYNFVNEDHHSGSFVDIGL